MATFNKYNQFVEDLAEKVHNLQSDTLKIALASGTGATGTWASLLSQVGEISGGNGYTISGNIATVSASAQTGGFYKLTLNSPAPWTGGGGGAFPMTGFRYAVLFNGTSTSPLNPLIGWWDYGSTVVLNSGETFTVTLDSTNGTLTIQ